MIRQQTQDYRNKKIVQQNKRKSGSEIQKGLLITQFNHLLTYKEGRQTSYHTIQNVHITKAKPITSCDLPKYLPH